MTEPDKPRMLSAMIRRLDAETIASRLAELSELLIDVVEGGGEVSYLSPMTRAKADPFWTGIAASVATNERVILVAEQTGRIVGTVQVILSQPENQPHRADLAKMMVHHSARRQGIGDALLAAAEKAAIEAGKTLIVLDTAGQAAERLYRRAGWQYVGTIPGYALATDGQPSKTSYFYKSLV